MQYAAAIALISAALAGAGPSSALANAQSKPEEIEWTWEVRPQHADASLPNVLLVGDSISRNYFPQVTRDLKGIANVYLMASSICVGDPRLPEGLVSFAKMEGVPFRVVHFNNGMHGWEYSEDEYKQAFPAYLESIRELTPGARLVWASTTPVRVDKEHGPSNDRLNARNALALALVSRASIPVDDQHALMMQHLDAYQDDVHFNDDGARIQGKQAAESIRKLLQ